MWIQSASLNGKLRKLLTSLSDIRSDRLSIRRSLDTFNAYNPMQITPNSQPTAKEIVKAKDTGELNSQCSNLILTSSGLPAVNTTIAENIRTISRTSPIRLRVINS